MLKKMLAFKSVKIGVLLLCLAPFRIAENSFAVRLTHATFYNNAG